MRTTPRLHLGAVEEVWEVWELEVEVVRWVLRIRRRYYRR